MEKDIKIMSQIQTEKSKSVNINGVPALDEEGKVVMSKKRISIDEPASEVKQDPLR